MLKSELDFQPVVLRPFAHEKDAPLSALQEEILSLKEKKNAILLAHNYQIDAIQRIADFTGDSLGLSFQAAKTEADSIVFCGVHFMAETAKIINPSKKVLLPDLKAGCSLADSCQAEKLAAYKEKYPHTYVVAYINCSAAVKALSDVICTSGNAIQIIEKIPQDREILFVPDQNLGQWVTQKTGRVMKLWPGNCYIHILFSLRSLEKVRMQFPQAPVVAHPECLQSIRDSADAVCSTEKMIDFSRNHPSDTIIVVTETGMLNRLRREIPYKTFVAGPTEHCACNDCKFMKMNTLEKLRDCLKYDQPEVFLDEAIREKAYKPIKQMLDWSS